MNPLKQLFAALSRGPGNTNAAPAQRSAPVPAGLLTPVSAAQPCGDSLEYDNDYAVLQARLSPKADVQYGNFSAKPESPDWVEVERDARRLLLRSKDISILIWFTRARTRMAGAHGLLEGLAALQAVLHSFSEHVHPQLLLDGMADPAVRANALAALCDPEGLLGDVREVVVSGSTAFRLSVRDVERALAVPRPPYAPDPDAIKRQLADLHAKSDPTLLALLECGACVEEIEHWSNSALGEAAPNLAPLLKLLSTLAAFADPVQSSPKVQADAVEPGVQRSWSAVQAMPSLVAADHGAPLLQQLPETIGPQGTLEQREHIRKLLGQVRQWIDHHEPSSPVSVLLKQADRMWGKRFSEVASMVPPELMQAWDRDE